MVHLLVVILDDIARMPALLDAWKAIGVPGVTVLYSVGGYRAETWLARVGLGALDRVFEAKEVQRRTLLVVIEGDDLLEQAIAEAERVVNGFDRPESGLLLTVPIGQVRGLSKTRPRPVEVETPPALQPDWVVRRDTPIEQLTGSLSLQPVIVSPDTPLDEVAQKMVAQPQVQVAAVVAEDGRLIGLLSLQALVDDLFFHILPEEFLSEISDLDEVMKFAEKSRLRTAGDAMQEPVWVRRHETVKQAFKRLHDHGLPGLPVVDERYHVVGYVNLLELLTICSGQDAEGRGEPC